MEFGSKLKELDMTPEEINRFSKALKDERFHEMLQEYAEEISNPENKQKYEEEITQLERDRGMEVKFIHPKPHHVLKTSVNGKEKCFINICSNHLINKPSCEPKRAENGQVGHLWSLPYSLTPGRPDRDSKGNMCTIYDVVFHPDTLYMADKNAKFMKLVNSTAVQGVGDAFKVKLDKPNTKLLKMQYKGVPHAAVTRKPIPGQCMKENSQEPFPIPYPDPVPKENAEPAPAPALTQKHSSPHKDSSSLPTLPHYTIKYRSVVDLQDYRCSRDSAPSPRPKEIIITVDLPLLKSAAHTDLSVTERHLVLESKNPAYKLELQLSYPVDDDKGDAKFNKAKKQLTITLPVKPAMEPAVVYTEGNQPDEPDEIESGNKAVMLCDAQLEKDKPITLNTSESQPLGDMKKEPESYSHEVIMGFEMKPDPSQLARTDETQTCERTHSNMSRPKDNSVEEGPGNVPSGTSKDISDCHLEDKESLHVSDMLPAFAEKGSQSPLTDETVTGSQLNITSAELQKASPLTETLHDVQNDPTSPSHTAMEKNEAKLSLVSDEPTKLNPALERDTINTVQCQEDTETSSEVPNSFTKLSSTEEKGMKTAELTEEEEEMIVNKPVNSACSSKQSRCDFTINSPAILREKNTKDGSEVIISNHATSAALSFQNSLWFELD